MFKSFFKSWRWAPYSYGGLFLIIGLLIFQVLTAWRFADWMMTVGNVMSAGKKYTIGEFGEQFVLEALIIAGLFIGIGNLLDWISKKFCIFWFKAMVLYYLPNWNKTLQDVSNPAERLQDSATDFINKIVGMTKAALRSLIVIFTGVSKLWILSSRYDFGVMEVWVLKVVNGGVYCINELLKSGGNYANKLNLDWLPVISLQVEYFKHFGMLVWIVLVICSLGFLVTRLFGINLEKCRNDIRTTRGYLRSGLEFIQRNKNRGDTFSTVEHLLGEFEKTSFRLFWNQFWYGIWTGIYGQFWSIGPLIFFGYNVFTGHVKYATVTKTQSAQGEIIGAMSTPTWLYDEWTDFKSTMRRLQELEETINNPKNWEEPKKEEGWEDRRANIFVLDKNGRKIEISREYLKKLLAETEKEKEA